MKNTQSISLKIPIAQVERFQNLTAEQKEVLTFFVTSLLRDSKFDISLIMDFLGFQAQRNGLTPEIFEEIVNEELA